MNDIGHKSQRHRTQTTTRNAHTNISHASNSQLRNNKRNHHEQSIATGNSEQFLCETLCHSATDLPTPFPASSVSGFHRCCNLDGHRSSSVTSSERSHANERFVRGEGVCIGCSDGLEVIGLDVCLENLYGPVLSLLCTPPELTLVGPLRTSMPKGAQHKTTHHAFDGPLRAINVPRK
jgi:hypothetical protein